MLDTNGNRKAVTLDRGFAGGGATQLSGSDIVTDAEDRLTQYGGVAFEHDGLGRVVKKTEGNAVTSYAWDSFGALKSVTLPDGKLIEYLTDAVGRRVGKRVDGVLQKRWVYRDSLHPAAELDAAGNVVSRFVYADGAGAATTPQYVVRAAQTLRVVADQLGSVRLLVDATSGAVVERVERDEFGTVLSDTAPGTVPFGFAGGFYDPDTGLVKFGAREYDARSGRWMSRDPILFGGGQTNLYAYVENDPINVTDVTGLLAGVPDWLEYMDNEGCLQATGDFFAGASSALTFGVSDRLIGATGLGQYGSTCSSAYHVGEYTTYALAAARLGYAGLAKAGSLVLRAPTMANLGAAIGWRNGLKVAFRLGLKPRARLFSF